MRHFVFVCAKRKNDRIGGSTYTLKVYENKAKGKLVYIGETTQCTRSHKGERSEAWSVVTTKFPALKKKLEAIGEDPEYFSWTLSDKTGIILQDLGGA